MGNDLLLLFHQEGNIPTSISLGNNPGQLLNQIENLEGFADQGVDPRGLPPEHLNGSPYKKEMDWILGLEDKSETYIKRLQEIYLASNESSIEYPEIYPFNAPSGSLRNPLSGQLKLVSRLLGGGIKTKVFLVKIGGFDNHAGQVESTNTTMGIHATKMYHISAAMKAFHADLKARGLEDKVLTISMSEFGRRIPSNGSYGTDHGKGGAVMVFGNRVNPGVFGTNPDLNKSNIDLQFDYRQLYANILHEWLGVDQASINNDIFFRDFFNATDENGNPLPDVEMVSNSITGTNSWLGKHFNVDNPFPNPAVDFTNLRIQSNEPGKVRIEILGISGQSIGVINKTLQQGRNDFQLDISGLKSGVYTIRVNAKNISDTKKLIKN